MNQHVNFLNFAIDEQKLKTIAQLVFSKTLKQFEIYLNLTNWFRDYIKIYAAKFKSLQKRKTMLLKDFSKFDNARKFYSCKIKILRSTDREMKSFQDIQLVLFRSVFLIHFDAKRQLYIDLDFSKKEDIEAMMYHVRENKLSFTEYSVKRCVQSILFFNRFLTSIEIRYWSTKLKIVGLVWMLRKIRHLVEFSKQFAIIYTDHEASFEIAKQTSLTTFSTDKLNLRLIRISNYIHRFELNIRHKSEKLHIVFDALSRLFTCNVKTSNVFDADENELDALNVSVFFIVSLVEIDKAFKDRIIEEYIKNSDWQKIIKIFDDVEKNNIKILFLRKHDLIFRKKIDDNTSFTLRRMCISESIIKDILSMTHDNDHTEFDRTYEKMTSSWYIRNLIKHLKNYFKHCSIYTINRTKRYKFYDSLQSVLFSSVSFHTLTINFVLILFVAHIDINNIMSVTCKFSKRVTIIFDIDTWIASQWTKTLLHRLNIANWKLSKVIISNKDRKFLSKLWIALFAQLNVKLLYFTIYHSQTNDVFERTNQTLKIALKSLILIIENFKDWSDFIEVLQKEFNNEFIAVNRSSNEICYEFTSLTSFSLLKIAQQKIFAENSALIAQLIRTQVKNNIAHDQMLIKMYYDKKHKFIQFDKNDWIFLRLHKDYNISNTIVFDSKLSQQYTEFFQILEKINTLAYKLSLSKEWRIHSIFSVAQLKLAHAFSSDLFKRISSSFDSIFVEDDTNTVKFFEIEKIITTKTTAKRKEFLIRWLEWGFEHDFWRKLLEMRNVLNLINDFEQTNFVSRSSRRDRSKKRS